MDYSWHIKKAIDFMEQKLAQPIDLDEVADSANFSRFHFHRIFLRVTGLTLKEYLRKRRLAEVAKKLIFTKIPIENLARSIQFDTQASFTRAFKKEFNCTPAALRRKSLPFPYFHPFKDEIYRKQFEGEIMQGTIVSKGVLKIVGMSIKTTMKENKIPQLWDKFNQKFCSIPNVIEHCALGICPFVDRNDCTDDTDFEYIAGVIVKNFENVPEGMITYEIPAAKYAVFTHHGTLDHLQETYQKIFTEWFSENDYELDEKAEFEWYDDRFKFGEKDSEIDLYIPIK